MEEEIINRIEAVLFSYGKKVDIAELRRLCKIRDEDKIHEAIEELKKRHGTHTSLMIIEEGDAWKMTIREKYLNFIRKIVTDTELPKTVMETLAVIAWKNPALQSDVIKIRTNKAYDHIKELQESGFVETVKHGRTRLIKLAKKFYEYFDIEGDKDIREMFGTIKEPKIPQTKVSEYDDEETEDKNDQEEDKDKETKVEVFDERPKIQVYEIPQDQELEIEKIQIVDEKEEENDEKSEDREEKKKKEIEIVDSKADIEVYEEDEEDKEDKDPEEE